MILSGVGDPFLQQNSRYHCPIYVILKFSKPRNISFERHIWYYDKGDYNGLRNKARQTDWKSLHDNGIDGCANNISNRVLGLAAECRNNCSSLNLDLFIKSTSISDFPMCACGSVEDTQHYFFH